MRGNSGRKTGIKLINKPIRKGTSQELKRSPKAACIASVILTGAVAFTAAGCTTDVKADRITVENLIVNGYERDGSVNEIL